MLSNPLRPLVHAAQPQPPISLWGGAKPFPNWPTYADIAGGRDAIVIEVLQVEGRSGGGSHGFERYQRNLK